MTWGRSDGDIFTTEWWNGGLPSDTMVTLKVEPLKLAPRLDFYAGHWLEARRIVGDEAIDELLRDMPAQMDKILDEQADVYKGGKRIGRREGSFIVQDPDIMDAHLAPVDPSRWDELDQQRAHFSLYA